MHLEFDNVTFDLEGRRLWVAGQLARLSPKAFDLLALLIERRPGAVAKAEIHERLWPGVHVSESSLPSLVSEIRDAIRDQAREQRFIRTLHGRGYAFDWSEQHPAAIPRHTAGWLLGASEQIALNPGENVLGRDGPDVIPLKSATVSRRHARIVVDATRATIEDLGSKNGTYVNNRRLSAQTAIAEGDEVRIGSLLFTFRRSQSTGSTETLSQQSSGRSGS
jgi:DNA-binding winged helix-turn-helix (wHTH) protein